jgi:hypothetical protein
VSKKLIGYKLSRAMCSGWLFCGTTPEDVARAVQNEIEANNGLSADEIDDMTIEVVEMTQQEINSLGEFQGW